MAIAQNEPQRDHGHRSAVLYFERDRHASLSAESQRRRMACRCTRRRHSPATPPATREIAGSVGIGGAREALIFPIRATARCVQIRISPNADYGRTHPVILRHINSRGALWFGFFGLILAAWAGVFAMVLSSPVAGIPASAWSTLCTSAAAASRSALFAMWALMSAAMMLPTFVPALGTFLNLGAAGATKPSEALALVAGYASIWLIGAGLGAMAQHQLTVWGLLAPDGSSLSRWLIAALLLAAGLYQFSLFKAQSTASRPVRSRPLSVYASHLPGA